MAIQYQVTSSVLCGCTVSATTESKTRDVTYHVSDERIGAAVVGGGEIDDSSGIVARERVRPGVV